MPMGDLFVFGTVYIQAENPFGHGILGSFQKKGLWKLYNRLVPGLVLEN